jgi:hypothetical protein
MAKTPKNTLANAPWYMTKKEFETFSPVTQNSRKLIVKVGRILYRIQNSGGLIKYMGHFVINPCLPKGMVNMEMPPFMKCGIYSVYMAEDMDRNEWRDSYDKIITLGIETGTLFFKQEDPILNFSN